jgi:hypothetical protein
MGMVTSFKQMLKTFVHCSIDDFFFNISETSLEKYKIKRYQPIFKNDGLYNGTEICSFIDYKRLVQEYLADIKKKPYYRIIFLLLKNRLQKKYVSIHIKNTDEQLEENTEKELRDFLISYLAEAGLLYDEKLFSRYYNKFEDYIENELGYDYCFAPLINFDGNFKSLELNSENHLHIRRITSDEFSIVSGIKNKTEKPTIDPIFFKLKYIVGGCILHSKIKEENIQKLFGKAVSALKIFNAGDVYLGGIYFRDSEIWFSRPTYVIKTELKTHMINRYNLSSSQVSQFKKFYKEFESINFTKGKYPFLYRSFSRFSNALENTSVEERIVDFVTSLESLYSSQEYELSHKFSLRIALLLGNSPKNKINLQDFMSQIYNIRSKVVHGDVVPEKIEIGSEKIIMSKEQSLKILEEITRNSIKIFLSIIKIHDSKEEIQNEIDRSIHDPIIRSGYSKLIKKMPYINLSFLDKLT